MPTFLAWPVLKGFFGGALSSVWAAIKSFFGALNSQGWAGLIGCCVFAWVSVHQWGEARHWHKQSNQYQKLYNADEAAAKRIAQQAVALKQQIDALARNISHTLKEHHDAESSRIHADADALRLRGPGKATCASHPGLSPGPGGHDQAASSAPDAGSPVPSGDWAVVPWSWLVTVIEEHDQLLNDDKAWNENDAKQRALRITTPAPQSGHN